MITLHHLETSRSQRVLWLLEELGLPYEIKIYQRNPKTRLAPAELKKIHPLGKSPVITDGEQTIAESGAILEYLVERYGTHAEGELAHLQPAPNTPEQLQSRFWMHYAEGSLMNWLLLKLVFTTLPKQPMPFFVKPIARQLCVKVLDRLVDPNLLNASNFIESHLGQHTWFTGKHISMADFQMSYVVEVLLSRGAALGSYPNLTRYKERMSARPAYQRALAKGGPVLMS
jgi:glutathione S-transferase